jgi:ribonuclease R
MNEEQQIRGKNWKDKVLTYLRDEAKKPVKAETVVSALIRKRKGRTEILRSIDDLVDRKEVVRLQGGYIALPEKLHMRTGTFLAHPDGYGFVTGEKAGDDLFIPPHATHGAMHQDRVLAVETGRDGRGRTEGQVLEIVERVRKTVVGVAHIFDGGISVKPRDPRIPHEFLGVGSIPEGVRDGDLVVLDITVYPDGLNIPEGRLDKSLGDAGNPALDTDLVLATYQLPESFPANVEAEAREMARTVPIAPDESREDLRDHMVLTIDGDNAKDFDDALSFSERHDGTFDVWIHIADVAAYVREGGVLDREAYRRGTSVYFPDRVVPMFPEVLSNGVLSLNPGEDRLSRTVWVHIGSTGTILDFRIFRSVIQSRLRATYSQVHRLLAGERSEIPDEPWNALISSMWNVAQIMRTSRFERGSLDFDLPEPEIVLDMRGDPVDIVRSPRYLSHQLIEEYMLLANNIVAGELLRRYGTGMFRVHESPSPEKLEDLAVFLGAMGIVLPVRKGGGLKAKDLSAVLESTRGTPIEKMVHFAVLRSLKQARYDVRPLGHFGLALTDYCHFTSPIRRYPDLIVHRLIDLKAGTSPSERFSNPIDIMAVHLSDRERMSVDAERMAVDLKRIRFMSRHLGKSFEGTISGVTGFGFFVELREILVEGLVTLSSLHDDFYVYDEKKHLLRGESTKRTFRIGDPVTVRVARVDSERLRIEFVLEGEAEGSLLERPKRPRKRPDQQGRRGSRRSRKSRSSGKGRGR